MNIIINVSKIELKISNVAKLSVMNTNLILLALIVIKPTTYQNQLYQNQLNQHNQDVKFLPSQNALMPSRQLLYLATYLF